ncbi:hypothetical protein EV651_11327 [Kribbella sp. VKM Ac-2571]|uniref:DUF4386 family protein n=1 Tax=Kribbella sp. VKM Ac-2571 TaxID=2512222 RepID=UPI00106095A9|nr:DUF4386 family protein [Kribbella sp. VKM Ac-2571]TDO56002.1 hypothetical protein EV651_11327 [Kribbella sp. VKM Ac-2571]
MTERHELRWGGFAGLAFVVLALLGRFLPGNPPTVDDSRTTITAWLSDNRGMILASALMWAAAGGLVIWFASAFAEAMRERDERSDVHLALLAGSVLVGGAIFVNAALTGATAFGIDGRDAGMTMAMYETTAVMTTMIGFAAALPLAAAGLGVMRTHLMPNWLGYLALLAAVVSFAGSFGVFASNGAFVAGGFLMTGIPLLLSAVWIACAGGYMVREHLPEITAGEGIVPQT